jgi:predicted component of type VI protein secretion system
MKDHELEPLRLELTAAADFAANYLKALLAQESAINDQLAEVQKRIRKCRQFITRAEAMLEMCPADEPEGDTP